MAAEHDYSQPPPANLKPHDRVAYQCEQVNLLRRLLGRELLRRGVGEQAYTRLELDMAVAATVEGDGQGNYLVTVDS